MKQFKFTLSRLLDSKDQVLETEKNTLAQLRQTRDGIERRIQTLEREFAETDRRLKEDQKKAISINQIKMYEYQFDSIRRQIKQFKTELRKAELEVERQVQVVVAASQEVSGLDKLKEKQLEEYQVSVARENETVINEFISGKLARESQGA